MVRCVVGSILHVVNPLSYFSVQPVLHDWCNKGRGMCYPVCGMVHIKEPLLLIGKSSLCGSSGFPFSLSECASLNKTFPYFLPILGDRGSPITKRPHCSHQQQTRHKNIKVLITSFIVRKNINIKLTRNKN